MRLPIVIAICASTAAAEPAESTRTRTDPATYDVGFRVGGYGFRREGDPRPGSGWTECRMNGFGVFGSRALRGPLFLEAGLDAYTSATGPVGPEAGDLPIDRMSALVSASIGVRTNLTSWMRGYLQLGGGAELTRVSVPYGDQTIRDDKAMPEGFSASDSTCTPAARTPDLPVHDIDYRTGMMHASICVAGPRRTLLLRDVVGRPRRELRRVRACRPAPHARLRRSSCAAASHPPTVPSPGWRRWTRTSSAREPRLDRAHAGAGGRRRAHFYVVPVRNLFPARHDVADCGGLLTTWNRPVSPSAPSNNAGRAVYPRLIALPAPRFRRIR